ncbi:Uncharacterized protein Fot_35549 [Forsythia ovata]|uniref:Uncharacterized protein n=1 Tax=Forsythia ovata TaxID=205694 RepID=A0ABD1SLU7_9LAMI
MIKSSTGKWHLKSKYYIFLSPSTSTPNAHQTHILPDMVQLLYWLAKGHKLNIGIHIFHIILYVTKRAFVKGKLLFSAPITGMCKANGVYVDGVEHTVHVTKAINKTTAKAFESQSRKIP